MFFFAIWANCFSSRETAKQIRFFGDPFSGEYCIFQTLRLFSLIFLISQLVSYTAFNVCRTNVFSVIYDSIDGIKRERGREWRLIRLPPCRHPSCKPPEIPTPAVIEKEFIKRQGKVRRCWLGDRIYSILCRASYFALGWIWRKGLIHPFLQIILEQFILFFNSS